jgi:hypothetical protein
MPIGVIPGRGSKPTDWKSIVAFAMFCTNRDYRFRTTAARFSGITMS